VAHDKVVVDYAAAAGYDDVDSDILCKLLHKTYNLDHLKLKHVVRHAEMITNPVIVELHNS
jgi:hypothetical protein